LLFLREHDKMFSFLKLYTGYDGYISTCNEATRDGESLDGRETAILSLSTLKWIFVSIDVYQLGWNRE
jgi:hypothetical protein